MIFPAFIVPLVALVVGSSASVLKPRGVSKNNCEREVAGTAKGAVFQASARKDCGSNIATTIAVIVTASASTYTSTVNVLATARSTKINTIIGSTTATFPATSTETDIYFSTAYSTSTETDFSTISATSISTETDISTIFATSTSTETDISTISATSTPIITASSVITVTASSVTTITSYYPTVVPIAKRGLEGRVNSGKIPTYASACTNFAEYAAACSAAGVTQGTSTVTSTRPASTITVITSSISSTALIVTASTESDLSFTNYRTTVVTKAQSSTTTQPEVATSIKITTAYQTIVTTLTQSSTVTVSVAATSVQTALLTVTADPSTTFIYQTVTAAASSAPSTVFVSAPVPTFKLAMVPVAGGTTLYMTVSVGDSVSYKSTLDPTLASLFTLDTSNRLITTAADPEIACAYSSFSNYYMEGLKHTVYDSYPQFFTALNCKVNSDLTLGCTYKTADAFTYLASESSFFYSTAGYNNYPTYIAHLIVQ